MAEQADDPLIGKVLSGRFEIVAPIGVGGMGRVYRAVQRPLDRVVALKVLNPRYDGTKDPGFERRFFLEASMTAKLKHPNTITVHDYGRTDDGIFYIAMEYVEGETLQHVLKEEGPLPWPRALAMGAQVARSLREAHKLGLVHRDLKPANIMLIAEGTGGDVVKVLDFGLVKSFTPDAPKHAVEVNATEITQAGVLLGSPLYMAPEQARNEADPRTDLYALGVVLFQCIAGRPPFVGKESIDVIVKHIREAPPQLRSLATEVPLEVNGLVMKCLEKDPAARFQSMDELLEAMRAATSGQGISGLFVDPRTASSTGIPRSMSGSQARSTSAQSQPRASTVSGVRPAETATPGPIHSDAMEAGSVDVVLSAEHPTAPNRALPIVLGLTALGLLAGGAFAWKLTRPSPLVVVHDGPSADTPKNDTPRSDPKTDPKTVTGPVKPGPHAKVLFSVTSDPPGADVLRDGVKVGVTPFELPLERTGADPLTLDLLFTLDGYEPVVVHAQGSDGRVPVTQQLVAKKAAPHKNVSSKKQPQGTPQKDNPAGYKDDPYQ